jgi:competence protein ComEA
MKNPIRIASMAIATLILFQVASAHAAEAAQKPAAGDMIVNINEATLDQLLALPDIGPSKAQAIVTFRGKQPFKKIEDLMRVKGIGRKTFAKLRPYLTINGQTTIPKK